MVSRLSVKMGTCIISMYKIIDNQVRFMPTTLEDLQLCGCAVPNHDTFSAKYGNLELHQTKIHKLAKDILCPNCDAVISYNLGYIVTKCAVCKVTLDIGPEFIFTYNKKEE